MKKYRGIRYAFRPKSYWVDTSVEQAVLRDVKGTNRRELLSQALASGHLERVDEKLQASEVSDAIRVGLGRIHPSLMAGEYLPGCDPGETEIARIELQSTTGDVFSIRARRKDGRIMLPNVFGLSGPPFPPSKDPSPASSSSPSKAHPSKTCSKCWLSCR